MPRGHDVGRRGVEQMQFPPEWTFEKNQKDLACVGKRGLPLLFLGGDERKNLELARSWCCQLFGGPSYQGRWQKHVLSNIPDWGPAACVLHVADNVGYWGTRRR
ncbi:hypothetical protein Landi51_03522 [Colletotrichum acutatum]